jgi:hypothetical protein
MRSFDNARLILEAMAQVGDSGGAHAEILKVVREKEPKYPASNLTAYLRELQSSKRGEILRYNPTSGKYFFSDPLYLAYVQCLLVPPKKHGFETIRIMNFDFDITETLKTSKIFYVVGHGGTRLKPNVKENVVDAEFVDDPDEKST